MKRTIIIGLLILTLIMVPLVAASCEEGVTPAGEEEEEQPTAGEEEEEQPTAGEEEEEQPTAGEEEEEQPTAGEEEEDYFSAIEARAGTWYGTTDFGSFTFVVSPDGMMITDFELVREVSIPTVIIAPTSVAEVAIPIEEDGSFRLIGVESMQLLFLGQFSNDGKRATGTWEWGEYDIFVEWEIIR